jgi:hypothetical protein
MSNLFFPSALALIEIEKSDRDYFMVLTGEIRGAARALKQKKA